MLYYGYYGINNSSVITSYKQNVIMYILDYKNIEKYLVAPKQKSYFEI